MRRRWLKAKGRMQRWLVIRLGAMRARYRQRKWRRGGGGADDDENNADLEDDDNGDGKIELKNGVCSFA